IPLGEARPEAYPVRRGRQLLSAERGAGTAEAAEDGERVAGHGLPDELAARLDLAVEAGRELVRLRLRAGPDQHELPAPLDAVALALEAVGEVARLAVRRKLDAHLPRCEAALDGLLLP